MTRTRHGRFWRPQLIDQNTHDRWLSHGEGTLLERVRRRLQELLDAGPAFTLDPAIATVIDDLAGHPRREQGGVTAHERAPGTARGSSGLS